jgi:hypothetical protein
MGFSPSFFLAPGIERNGVLLITASYRSVPATALLGALLLGVSCTNYKVKITGDAAAPPTDGSGSADHPLVNPGTGGAPSPRTDAGTGGAHASMDGAVPFDAPKDVSPSADGPAACVAGQKRCGAGCVAINDPKYGCGTATCDVSGCPTVSGGTLVCQGQACVLGTCTAGTKKCSASCVDVNDPAYGCGATTCDATMCPSPGAGGSVTCQAGVCAIATCGSGMKKCTNKCVSLTDPTYGCGPTTCDATTCPAAGTGTLICQSGACVIGSCGAGTKKCGDKCVPTDVNNGCGDPANCTACSSGQACMGSPTTTCQCVPTPMATACMGKCGSVPNGCGGNYTCGTCTAPQTCAGGGVANVCGCTPDNTAACNGKACGPATNNCGQAVTCVNTCSGTNVSCGGGVVGPNACGCTPPLAMAAACAGKCGPISDGCTGMYTCAGCATGQKCDPSTHTCTALCTGVSCGTNLKCDPTTGMCVDICSGGGTGTVSHCCSAGDCPATLPLCTGGVCVGRPAGQGCTTSAECASTHCTDGVCCNVAVCGACQACNLSGAGTCSNKCPAAAPTTCGNDGTCDASGACHKFTGNVCVPGSCSNPANSSEPGTCQGGSCVAKKCDYHGCASDGTCASTCPAGNYDTGTSCAPQKGLGQSCTAANQCTGNNCSSDQVCCSSTCTATCQGCTSANTGLAAGTCGPRTSNTTVCNGTCPAGKTICGSNCVPNSWNFNQGNVVINGMPYGWGPVFDGGTILYDSSVSHSGSGNTGALAMRPAPSATDYSFSVNFCPSVDLTGKTITMWVMRSTPTNDLFSSDCGFLLGTEYGGTNTIGPNANVWTPISTGPIGPGADASSIGISCMVPEDGWDGTLYLDDVSISP